jgi:hypothetical protein
MVCRHKSARIENGAASSADRPPIKEEVINVLLRQRHHYLSAEATRGATTGNGQRLANFLTITIVVSREFLCLLCFRGCYDLGCFAFTLSWLFAYRARCRDHLNTFGISTIVAF